MLRSGRKKTQAEVVGMIRKKVEMKLRKDAKGTLGDYIRLVQLEKELEGAEPTEVRAQWIESEKKWYRALWFREQRLVGGLLIGKGNRAGKRRYLDAIKAKTEFPQAEHE